MNKALYFTKLEQIKDINNCDRIYFGNEYCRFLIPKKTELTECISKIKNKPLTLTTPIINDFDFEKIKDLLNVLERYLPDSEVMINDFGVLEILKEYKSLKPVLGRILISFPAYISDKIYINDHSVLKLIHVNRIEINNYEKIIETPHKILISLHVPFTHITTTRLCSSNNESLFNKSLICNLKCKTTRIKYPSIKEGIIQKGNTQFMKKSILLKQNASIIDRLVISRDLPI